MNLKQVLPLTLNYYFRNFPRFLSKSIDIEKSSVGRIFFVDAADYGNAGDLAISYAMELFLKKVSDKEIIVFNERDFPSVLRALKTSINPFDVICLSGGGNMGVDYQKYEAIRRFVIENFRENKIIIFPQTISYASSSYGQKEQKRSVATYAKAEQLHLFAREKKSYEIMQKLYSRNCVHLAPDIVLSLDSRCNAKSVDSAAYCLRDDEESILNSDIRNEIIQDLASIFSNVNELSTTNKSFSGDRAADVKAVIDSFSGYDLVVTDRLHGMIFALLAGAKCVAIDNSNGKVSGVVEQIKDDFPVCLYANDPSFSDVIKVLQSKDLPHAKPDFSELVRLF